MNITSRHTVNTTQMPLSCVITDAMNAMLVIWSTHQIMIKCWKLAMARDQLCHPTKACKLLACAVIISEINLTLKHHGQNILSELTTQQQFKSPLSQITRVSRYQKKYSPNHTHPDHKPPFINFLHLQWSIASSYVVTLVNWINEKFLNGTRAYYTIQGH